MFKHQILQFKGSLKQITLQTVQPLRSLTTLKSQKKCEEIKSVIGIEKRPRTDTIQIWGL